MLSDYINITLCSCKCHGKSRNTKERRTRFFKISIEVDMSAIKYIRKLKVIETKCMIGREISQIFRTYLSFRMCLKSDNSKYSQEIETIMNLKTTIFIFIFNSQSSSSSICNIMQFIFIYHEYSYITGANRTIS